MWISMPTPVTKSSQIGGERIEQEAEVGVELRGRAVALEEAEVRVAGTEPGVDDLFEGLSSPVSEMRVLDNSEAGKHERDHDRADTDRADGGFLHAPSKEKHHRGPKGREERNKPDVVKK